MSDAPKHPWRVIAAASAGNALEFYDIIVFAFFAQQIGSAFFPAASPHAARLQAWAVFGVAFFARPIGAIVLGSYADRAGRRASLTLSIMLMTAGTALLAFMPRHETIGIVAPFGILLARLIQGFSAGGEFGGATAFMMEHAHPSRRGFFASFQFTSQAISNIFACLVALAVNDWLSPATIDAWGFRIPFVIGLLIGPVGLYLRHGVDETPEFLAATKLPSPAYSLFTQSWGRVLLATGVIALGTVATYVNLYLPSFAASELHLPVQTGLLVTLAASIISFVVTPIVGGLSDRADRLRVPIICATLLVLSVVPSIAWAVHKPGIGKLVVAIGLMTALRAAYSAPIPALLAELFPVELRGVGMSLGYTLGVAVFGGFTATMCEMAVTWSGNPTAPAYVVAAAGLITLASLCAIARFIPAHKRG